MGGLTLYCMLLLVETSRLTGNLSFGDLSAHFYGTDNFTTLGPIMKSAVLGSIAVSQMGFSCAYYIFIGRSLADMLMIFSDCRYILPSWVFILVQAVCYTPLSWIRRIEHFSITSLVGDGFILAGISPPLAHN